MPEMTLTEAAKWAGVTRPTIFKALKSGRLSGRKDEAGEWRIDPAELERAYAVKQPDDTAGNAALSNPNIAEALVAKDREIALLREALDDARVQRDRAMALAEAQTKLLVHEREKMAPTVHGLPLLRRWLRRTGPGG